MIRIRRFALAAVGTVVFAAACTSISIPSIPPIPTLPPIDIPSFVLPSGFVLPTADPNSASCSLITSAEMSAIMGGQFSATSGVDSSCTYTSGVGGVIVSVTPDTDLTGVRFLFGESAADLTVGGFPAISGQIFGQPGVYVQRPDGQLSVQGIVLGDDPATLTKLVQVATTALGRIQ